MFSRFFIDRPIFATVLSIIITLAGAVSVFTLPITQYPEITPPTIEVSAIFAGANAKVVADTVAAPVEQQVNGVEGMLYMSSQCTNDGTYSLTVTFRPGTNLNLAQVLVQNRVALAYPILPDLVKRRGITVKKKSASILMMVNLYSPDASRESLYLSNYATIQLRDELSRMPGVGDIAFLGQRDYSMRIWIDPQRLAMRGLSTSQVIEAIEQQNTQVAAGQIGQPPTPIGQVFQYTMSTRGRLSDEDEFGRMVLKTDDLGRVTRLEDVARIELGAVAYDQNCTLDGQPSVALSIYQLPGSNALDTARQIRTKMEELKGRFPAGVDYAIVYDTTPFIRESVSEVFVALRDAVVLVALVVLVFLQGWRAAIIPLVAVPVAVVGTFAAMAAVDFSLNTLTLFGLVLAVGIVVDDAIVVVEAVEHHIELGLSPRNAAIQAMHEVAGPVIAIGLVLSAVFLPCTFISGIVGQFYRQFALTIAISTLISAFNSLTLSPALAVLLLRPRHEGEGEALPRAGLIAVGALAGYFLCGPTLGIWLSDVKIPLGLSAAVAGGYVAGLTGALILWIANRHVNRLLISLFRLFNQTFQSVTRGYVSTVRLLLRGSLVMLVLYGVLIYGTYHLFQSTPTGFIPAQDKGYLMLNVRLADSASLSRTQSMLAEIQKIAQSIPGVRHTVAISGQSILLGANAPNFGTMYLMLDDFQSRTVPDLKDEAIAAKLQQLCDQRGIDCETNVLGAPPIDGLGTAGGFKIVIEDRSDNGLEKLETISREVVRNGNSTPGLRDLFTSFRANTTWLQLDIDRDAVKSMGIALDDVFHALQVNFGSLYVNDFNRFGRTWQVNVQADQQFRMRPEDLKSMYVPGLGNRMIPFSTFAEVREVTGPVMIARYNLYPSAIVNGDAAEGTSSGQAIEQLENVAEKQLMPGMRAEWTELALLQQNVSGTAWNSFVLAVVLVFLVLAAQYESWALPLAVILVVPMCLLCALVGVVAARMDVNIFTQIGFVVLVGLACKNAILIVEFARARHVIGVSRIDATLQACQLRLRPIVMTSFAFIFGVIPLALGTGAGAEMRRTLGTTVFAGMLGVTLFGIFLTPIFFYVIQAVVDWRRTPSTASDPNRD